MQLSILNESHILQGHKNWVPYSVITVTYTAPKTVTKTQQIPHSTLMTHYKSMLKTTEWAIKKPSPYMSAN